MTDLNAKIVEIAPSPGTNILFFSVTKVAQNDTITFGSGTGSLALVAFAAGFTHDGLTTKTVEVITINATIGNRITLTSAGLGTTTGLVVGSK